MGVPVKHAMLPMLKTMPIRVPILVKSVVRLDNVDGNSVCTAFAQMPYKMTKAVNPLRLETAIQL